MMWRFYISLGVSLFLTVMVREICKKESIPNIIFVAAYLAISAIIMLTKRILLWQTHLSIRRSGELKMNL